MNTRGFSLIELVAVIGIAAVLMAIATLNYNQWSNKYNIQKQVREMYSDIMLTRLSAIQQKQSMSIFFGPNQYNVVDAAGNVVSTKRLNYQIANGAALSPFNLGVNDVQFDNHGFANVNNLMIVVLPMQSSGENCVRVSQGLTNIGRINDAGIFIAK